MALGATGRAVRRPSRNGLLLLATSIVVGITGWILGQPELTALAVTGALALVGALVWVRFTPVRLEVQRGVQPARIRVGEEARVLLRFRNTAARGTSVLRLGDTVGRGHADHRRDSVGLSVAPIPSGATRDAGYRYPGRTRGIHAIGPLEVEVEDPFSLASSRIMIPSRTALVVLPRTWPLDPLPSTLGDEPDDGTSATISRSNSDEEFASLRAYEPGDDIRRIHWRSTARTGRLVVQQYDQPWQRRTTVVVDTRRQAHDAASFERAVAAAASVVELAARTGELIRLVSTDGIDSQMVSAESNESDLLDRLAMVAVSGTGSMAATMAALGPTTAGRIVVCTGTLDTVAHAGLCDATRRWELRVLVATGAVAPSADTSPPALVHWPSETDLSEAWSVGTAELRDPMRVGR